MEPPDLEVSNKGLGRRRRVMGAQRRTTGEEQDSPTKDVQGRDEDSATSLADERESLQKRVGQWLDLPLAVLALIWAALLVVELAVDLPPDISERVLQVDFAIWVVFVLDFILEFALAPNKLRYLQGNYLAALSLALPFVRAVRVAGLFRVLRSVSLARIVLISNRATVALADLFSRHLFQYVVSLVVVTTTLGAAGVYFFERDNQSSPLRSFGETLWWASTVATTINAGPDPVTAEGRIVALILRVVALAVFGYVTASIASFLVGRRVEEGEPARTERENVQTLVREIEALRGEVRRLRAEVRALDGWGGEEARRQGQSAQNRMDRVDERDKG